jgi:hypothetical protein
MSTAAQQALADQKRAVRSDMRRALKALSPDQRASEGDPSNPLAGSNCAAHQLLVGLPLTTFADGVSV